MDYLVIAAAAFVVSGLTLFSGFGLGTVLMPAFALYFPLPTAIAATAVVHLANNLFKLGLVGRHADRGVVLRFGLPAALAAILGAGTLVLFAGVPALGSYEFLGRRHEVTALDLAIGLLIVGFALVELSRVFDALTALPKHLVLGGLLSGFFGGLSGNQGAFRSAFLLKAGLDKRAFVATGVVSAVLVDLVRLAVYGVSHVAANFEALPGEAAGMVAAATLAAFLGAFIGAWLLAKTTMRAVRVTVAVAMTAIGLGLAAGLI